MILSNWSEIIEFNFLISVKGFEYFVERLVVMVEIFYVIGVYRVIVCIY